MPDPDPDFPPPDFLWGCLFPTLGSIALSGLVILVLAFAIGRVVSPGLIPKRGAGAAPTVAAADVLQNPRCLFEAGETVNLSFNGQRFTVPRRFIFSYERNPDDAFLRLRWPSFRPLCETHPAPRVNPEEQGTLRLLLDYQISSVPIEEILARVRRGLGPRLPGGQLFGLDREAPGPGSNPYQPRDLFLGHDAGVLSVLINCRFTPIGDGCNQFFVTSAGLVHVSYAPRLLPHWAEIQRGVATLLQQWELEARKS